MNQRNITLLLMAIIAMMMLTWFQNGDQETDERARLFPQLEENLDRLARVEVRTVSGSLSLVKQVQGWSVAEKYSYPADFSKLFKLLDGLSKTHLSEAKTTKSENYSILEVRELSDEASQAKQVSGFGEDYSFSILIGKSAQGQAGQFVRKPDDVQVWLADRSLDVDVSAVAWLEPEIIDIEAEKIASIEQYDMAGELQFTAGLDESDSELVLRNLPVNRSLKYPSIASELARALANVRLTDVRPHKIDLWSKSHRTIYTLVEGMKITVRAVDTDEEKWIHISVDQPEMADSETGSESESDKDSESETGLHLDDLQVLGKWDYQVSGYVFDRFAKNLDDLLAPLEDVTPQ